jgi:hypothetical protein
LWFYDPCAAGIAGERLMQRDFHPNAVPQHDMLQPEPTSISPAPFSGNRNVLLIALEMPPARSAGVQRPYRFAEYLLELGWNPIVLTASSDIYQRFDHELQIPAALAGRIYRAKAYDASRLFSIAGRSPDWLALPDRYWPWYLHATKLGQQLIQQFDIGCIWSTYPVLTAHLIGRKLSKTNNLPWIADFRDPIQCHYNPAYQHFNTVNRYLERKIVQSASKVCTTSNEAAQLYRSIYPEQASDKFCVIENGFVPLPVATAAVPDKFTLLYSGALYGNGRDINGIFRVLQQLKQQHLIHQQNFVLRFRGSAKPERYAKELAAHDIADLVEFAPAIAFEQAVAEMQQCSANMLIQDEIFKYQIPGKLYDYIQSQKPLLAICPDGSATANVCRTLPNCWRVWQDAELATAISALLAGHFREPLDTATANSYSRRARTVQLASLMQSLLLEYTQNH